MSTINTLAADKRSPKETVRLFLEEVRSGKCPERAGAYMADRVMAHQLNAENPVSVNRTPQQYTAHINEFLALFGDFKFEITEMLAEGDKVYARWIQHGIHQSGIDEYKVTGLPLIEYTSAVYRVDNEKIVEYHLQTDRFGMQAQLEKNALLSKEQ